MRGEKKRSQEGFSRQRAEKNVGYLRERSLLFLDVGRRMMAEQRYDMAAFHVEQFCQLFLKYQIGLRLGEFSKTHSLTQLLLEFGGACDSRDKVLSFVGQHKAVIRDLEQAYLGARYIPLEYSEEQVVLMLRFADVLKEFTAGRP